MVSAHEATRQSLVDMGALGSVGGTGGRQGWRGQRVGWWLLELRRLSWNRVVDPCKGMKNWSQKGVVRPGKKAEYEQE